MPKVSKDGFVRVQLSYNPDKEPDIDHYIKTAENSGLSAYLKKTIRDYEESETAWDRFEKKLDLLLSMFKSGSLVVDSDQEEIVEAEKDEMLDSIFEQVK